MAPHVCCIFLLASACIPCATAGSAYVGYSQSEQQSFAGERLLHFTPKGNTAQLSFDVTKQLSVAFDYAKLNDSLSLANNVDGAIEIQSWGVSASYYWEQWTLSVNYSAWQDDLNIALLRADLSLFSQHSESPSSAISLGYHWDISRWQIGLVSGLHYGDWQLEQYVTNPQTQLSQSLTDQGSSSFVSLSMLFARLVNLGAENDLIVGGSLGWNQLISSESQAITRNGRNISQINNRILANRLSATATIGTQSYAQVSLYASYTLADNWLLDIDASYDLNSDHNAQAWSLNVGYMF